MPPDTSGGFVCRQHRLVSDIRRWVVRGGFHEEDSVGHHFLGNDRSGNWWLSQAIKVPALTLFDFTNGKTTVRKAHKLPKHEFVIPQKGDGSVPNPTVGANAGTKSLGVIFDLMKKGQHHVDYIAEKGNEWVLRLNSNSYLSRLDAWCSYMYQLEPSLAYLIETLSANPKKIEKVQQNIYLKSLSWLGVNKHIIETIRRMSHKYGGLNMFDLNIKGLGVKLHYLRTYSGSPTQEGRHLKQMYEAFLMDIGLGGNIFDRNYESLEYLAENSWFQHPWRLCHQFDYKLKISFPAHIQEQQKGDKALMDIFLDSKLFRREKLMVLQRTRRFKKVHFLSDCLCMNRRRVHLSMLTKL